MYSHSVAPHQASVTNHKQLAKATTRSKSCDSSIRAAPAPSLLASVCKVNGWSNAGRAGRGGRGCNLRLLLFEGGLVLRFPRNTHYASSGKLESMVLQSVHKGGWHSSILVHESVQIIHHPSKGPQFSHCTWRREFCSSFSLTLGNAKTLVIDYHADEFLSQVTSHHLNAVYTETVVLKARKDCTD